jgi:glycerol-3-phosphate O-acyltransferase
MSQQQQLYVSDPWPAAADHGVVFLLDTRSRFERQLLEGWIAAHQGERECTVLSLSLAGGEKEIKTQALKGLADNHAAAALVVPLRIAWTPPSAALQSGPQVRDFLFGDPRRPGSWRGRRILKREPQRVHCIAAQPATLAELQQRFATLRYSEAAGNSHQLAGFVARQAGIALDIAERSLRGGRYKVPRYVRDSLLASPAYLEELEALALEEGKSLEQMLKECRVYMKEMISIPRTFWIDVFARFNDFVLGLGYQDQIVYDKEAAARARQMVRDNPSMLLWTHKTYLDGLAVPKVLFENDYPLPHMFGGANLSFAGLGFLLRRSGAIFIRRSFQDNPGYKLTLRHYIGYLMEKRFPMNWSFEGTRSRIGKLMPVRYGLLKYVLEACHATDARNIHIIPISVSYDLIRDVQEYATEQTGRGKGAESLRWFIGYIRSLAKPMGKIYLDFGEPVILERCPDPEDKLALSKIGFEVAVQANNVTPITYPSMITMSLLGAAPQALTNGELVAEVQALLDWARQRGIRVSSDFEPQNAEAMRGLLELMINENVISRYDEGPEVVYAIALEQHPVASFYRNTIIHFFVNKALIEMSLLRAAEAGDAAAEVFWQEVENLRDLFKFEFFYAPSEEFRRQIAAELERVTPQWSAYLERGASGVSGLLEKLHPLVSHATLLTYVEAYTVVADFIARTDPMEELEEKATIEAALKFGRQAYLQRRISSEASIGRILFQNAFKYLANRGLIEPGPDIREKRIAEAQALRVILRRLELVRGLVMDRRGSDWYRQEVKL